jgi:hypothetical protein
VNCITRSLRTVPFPTAPAGANEDNAEETNTTTSDDKNSDKGVHFDELGEMIGSVKVTEWRGVMVEK